ncbi:MAG: M56 family metallopeptidase [Lachnospiraceae bacterium]|nr:M56 family metallopeptidase [Lachnospiraceae bacterium]
MTNVFLSFLEISIPISLIIVVLLLLTPFLNKRYAAKWKYWIWIVLALRLLIPFGGNVGQSVADLQPQRETLTSSESEKTPPDALADGTARGRVIVEIPAQMTAPIVIQPEKAGGNISMLNIIVLVWMLGSLLFISVHLVSYFHYKHQILKKGKIVKDNDVLLLLLKLKRELHINCTVSVIEYQEAASPLLIGFFNHILVLPNEQYNSEELFFILKHELVHLKRGDIYLKLLFAVANAVHWFNPLIWIMQKEAAVDMELSCDERVTQGTDYATRKAYTETLLSTLHKQSIKKTVLSTGFYGGKQIMKKRFKNILAKKGKKNGVTVLICIIVLAVSMGTLVGCSILKENTEDGAGSLGTEDFDAKDMQAENSQTDEPIPESDRMQVFTLEEMTVTPEIAEYDFESACEKGEVRQMRGMLPGMGEGTWYTIAIDGVEYYYARYDDFPDKTELFEYAIVSGGYSLANGISVGMTKSELLERYPNMRIEDTEGNVIDGIGEWTWWNHTAYPRSLMGMDEEWDYDGAEYYYWDSQFDYIMIADIEQEPDTLPLSVALMMKDDVVAAITFYYPTAN